MGDERRLGEQPAERHLDAQWGGLGEHDPVYTVLNRGPAMRRGDDGHSPGERLELGQPEPVGERGKEKDVRLPVEAIYFVAGDRPVPEHLSAIRQVAGHRKRAGPDEMKLDRLVPQAADRLEHGLNALAEDDLPAGAGARRPRFPEATRT